MMRNVFCFAFAFASGIFVATLSVILTGCWNKEPGVYADDFTYHPVYCHLNQEQLDQLINAIKELKR